MRCITWLLAAGLGLVLSEQGRTVSKSPECRDYFYQVDTAATTFLKLTANAGLAELDLGKLAQQKATHHSVRALASMIVEDHRQTNLKVKSLAATRKIKLTDRLSADKVKKAKELKIKSGRDFDESFAEQMIADHKQIIDLYEKYNSLVSDIEVKNLITSTLPKLKMHLDSAHSVQQSIRR